MDRFPGRSNWTVSSRARHSDFWNDIGPRQASRAKNGEVFEFAIIKFPFSFNTCIVGVGKTLHVVMFVEKQLLFTV